MKIAKLDELIQNHQKAIHSIFDFLKKSKKPLTEILQLNKVGDYPIINGELGDDALVFLSNQILYFLKNNQANQTYSTLLNNNPVLPVGLDVNGILLQNLISEIGHDLFHTIKEIRIPNSSGVTVNQFRAAREKIQDRLQQYTQLREDLKSNQQDLSDVIESVQIDYTDHINLYQERIKNNQSNVEKMEEVSIVLEQLKEKYKKTRELSLNAEKGIFTGYEDTYSPCGYDAGYNHCSDCGIYKHDSRYGDHIIPKPAYRYEPDVDARARAVAELPGQAQAIKDLQQIMKPYPEQIKELKIKNSSLQKEIQKWEKEKLSLKGLNQALQLIKNSFEKNVPENPEREYQAYQNILIAAEDFEQFIRINNKIIPVVKAANPFSCLGSYKNFIGKINNVKKAEETQSFKPVIEPDEKERLNKEQSIASAPPMTLEEQDAMAAVGVATAVDGTELQKASAPPSSEKEKETTTVILPQENQEKTKVSTSKKQSQPYTRIQDLLNELNLLYKPDIELGLIKEPYSSYLSDCLPLHKDSIDYEIMTDPVMAADGYTYQREGIEAWIQHKIKEKQPILSPMTIGILESTEVFGNQEIRGQIIEYLQRKIKEKKQEIEKQLQAQRVTQETPKETPKEIPKETSKVLNVVIAESIKVSDISIFSETTKKQKQIEQEKIEALTIQNAPSVPIDDLSFPKVPTDEKVEEKRDQGLSQKKQKQRV